MDASQQLILLILACTIALFLWGRWRHDIVALAALLACVVTGLTPAADAFVGFGHPAVITVAAGDTAATLARRMPFEKFRLEWFETLNGLPRGQSLIPGSQVKIVAE